MNLSGLLLVAPLLFVTPGAPQSESAALPQEASPSKSTAVEPGDWLVGGCYEVVAGGPERVVGEITVTPTGNGGHTWDVGGGGGTFTPWGDIESGGETFGRFEVQDLDGDGIGEFATLDFEGVSPRLDGFYVLQPCGTQQSEMVILRTNPFDEIVATR